MTALPSKGDIRLRVGGVSSVPKAEVSCGQGGWTDPARKKPRKFKALR
jgi:hypothetical protein